MYLLFCNDHKTDGKNPLSSFCIHFGFFGFFSSLFLSSWFYQISDSRNFIKERIQSGRCVRILYLEFLKIHNSMSWCRSLVNKVYFLTEDKLRIIFQVLFCFVFWGGKKKKKLLYLGENQREEENLFLHKLYKEVERLVNWYEEQIIFLPCKTTWVIHSPALRKFMI